MGKVSQPVSHDGVSLDWGWLLPSYFQTKRENLPKMLMEAKPDCSYMYLPIIVAALWINQPTQKGKVIRPFCCCWWCEAWSVEAAWRKFATNCVRRHFHRVPLYNKVSQFHVWCPSVCVPREADVEVSAYDVGGKLLAATARGSSPKEAGGAGRQLHLSTCRDNTNTQQSPVSE